MPRGRRVRPSPRSHALAAMTLDATGTLRDSTSWADGCRSWPSTHTSISGAPDGRADGRFEGFNPATLADRKELDGNVSGTVERELLASRDITGADHSRGHHRRRHGDAGAVHGRRPADRHGADVDGKYADAGRRHDAVQVTGPDVKADASGRLALDRTSASNLKYHVDAINLASSPAGRADGCRRRRLARRHDHRQRRVADDDRHAERQQPRLRREQRARSRTASTP